MNRVTRLRGMILCATLILPVAALGASTTALTWHDLAGGKALAAESGRPLVVHFTADWCKWCKVMQRDTYTDPAVDALLREAFVAVRIDTDREPRLRAEFGVQGLPTIWFLSAAGEPITYIPGYVDAPTFQQVLRWIASGAYKEQTFDAYLAAGRP